jgi:hypothetical protein
MRSEPTINAVINHRGRVTVDGPYANPRGQVTRDGTVCRRIVATVQRRASATFIYLDPGGKSDLPEPGVYVGAAVVEAGEIPCTLRVLADGCLTCQPQRVLRAITSGHTLTLSVGAAVA